MWDLADRYARAKIKERFGYTFKEYIDLPMPEANLLNLLSFEVIAAVELEERKREQEIQKAAIEAAKNDVPSNERKKQST